MKKNAWNIIFIAVDILGKDTKKNSIEQGIKKFKSDVEKSKYDKNLKITLLDCRNETPIGDAKVYSNFKKKGKSFLIEKETIGGFDMHSEDSYFRFINKYRLRQDEKRKEKVIIIFLAHSFGAGFLYFKSNIENQPHNYLSTVQIKNAIEKVFKKKKISCFCSISCSFQTIESNYIFKDTASFLIGSQQILVPEVMAFDTLLNDLISSHPPKKNYDQNLYLNFIINTNQNFSNLYGYIGKVPDSFSIALTNPNKASVLFEKLNEFSKIIQFHNVDNKISYKLSDSMVLKNVKDSLIDPSFSDGINIFDAHQFFIKLRNHYFKDEAKIAIINTILKSLDSIIILKIVYSDSYQFNIKKDIAMSYIPGGLGIFIPKVPSYLLDINIDIYSNLYKKVNNDYINLILDSRAHPFSFNLKFTL